MSLKTVQTSQDVEAFIKSLADKSVQEDCKNLVRLMTLIAGQPPKMWGTKIVGFGTYSYTRSDGKLYEYLALGFSPRANALTIYNIPGYEGKEDLMAQLGTYTHGKSCLYVKKLADIDLTVLQTILAEGYALVAGKHLDYKTGVWTSSVKT